MMFSYKALLIGALLVVCKSSYSQQFSDYFDASANNWSGFSYNVTVAFTKVSEDDIFIKYTCQLIKVQPDSKGYYSTDYRKYYSCSTLGDFCNPVFYRIGIDVIYQCDGAKKYTGRIGFKSIGETGSVTLVKGNNGVRCKSVSLTEIKVNQAEYGTGDASKYRNRIKQLEDGQSSTRTQTVPTSPQSSVQQTKQAGTNVNIQNNSSVSLPSKEEQMRQLGIDPNADYLGNTISMGAGFIGDIAASISERRERKERERIETANMVRQQLVDRAMPILQENLPLAEGGNAEAMVKVAETYWELLDDKNKALSWMEKAILLNHPRALRYKYEWYQKICEQEKKQPTWEYKLQWVTKAAEAGDAKSMRRLADMCKYTNPQLYQQWIHRAADAGDIEATRALVKDYLSHSDKEMAFAYAKYLCDLIDKQRTFIFYIEEIAKLFGPMSDKKNKNAKPDTLADYSRAIYLYERGAPYSEDCSLEVFRIYNSPEVAKMYNVQSNPGRAWRVFNGYFNVKSRRVQIMLSDMYKHGDGVEKSRKTSNHFYTEAMHNNVSNPLTYFMIKFGLDKTPIFTVNEKGESCDLWRIFPNESGDSYVIVNKDTKEYLAEKNGKAMVVSLTDYDADIFWKILEASDKKIRIKNATSNKYLGMATGPVLSDSKDPAGKDMFELEKKVLNY